MKRTALIIAASLIVATLAAVGRVQIVPNADLTIDRIENRQGKILVEKSVGEVLDEQGNGRLLDPQNPDYDYISYKFVDGAQVGDTVTTYLVFNPLTTGEDDYILRFDRIAK